MPNKFTQDWEPKNGLSFDMTRTRDLSVSGENTVAAETLSHEHERLYTNALNQYINMFNSRFWRGDCYFLKKNIVQKIIVAGDTLSKEF